MATLTEWKPEPPMTTALEVLRLLNSRLIKSSDELYQIADDLRDLELLDHIDAGNARLKKAPFKDAAEWQEDDCMLPATAPAITPDDYLVLNALRNALGKLNHHRTNAKQVERQRVSKDPTAEYLKAVLATEATYEDNLTVPNLTAASISNSGKAQMNKDALTLSLLDALSKQKDLAKVQEMIRQFQNDYATVLMSEKTEDNIVIGLAKFQFLRYLERIAKSEFKDLPSREALRKWGSVKDWTLPPTMDTGLPGQTVQLTAVAPAGKNLIAHLSK